MGREKIRPFNRRNMQIGNKYSYYLKAPCIYCRKEGKQYKMKLKPKHKKKEIEYEW